MQCFCDDCNLLWFQEHNENQALPSLQERFKGMVALYASNLPSTTSLATSAGCVPATQLQLLLQPQKQQQQQQQQQQDASPLPPQRQGVYPQQPQPSQQQQEEEDAQQQQQQQHQSSIGGSSVEGAGLLDMFAPPPSHKAAAGAGQGKAAAGDGSSSSEGLLLPDPAEAARSMLQELGGCT